MPLKHLGAIQALLITLLISIAYFEVRHHHFVWDTIPFVLENPWIHEWSVENVTAMLTRAHLANWQPMVMLSHAVDFSLFGNNSGMHHVVNLIFHIANALLLAYLVHLLVMKSGSGPIPAMWAGFLTGLIFGLHPQYVESVAWVVERKDVLYTLFTLISLTSYLKYYEQPGWRRHAVPFTFFCLAIASKPMAVTLPVILLLLDIFPLKQATDIRRLLTLVLHKSHYFVVTLLVIGITLINQSMAMPDAANLPLWARTLNAIDNTLFYALGYLWPVNLSPFYPYPQNAQYLASFTFWGPGLIFLTTSTIAGLWLWYRGTAWPFLLFAFYIVTLSPVSGLIHVGPAKATDHYVYMSTIPFSLLTALLLVWAWRAGNLPRLLAGSLGTFYIIFLLLMTQLQVSVWSNPLTLWTRVVQLYPASPFGHRNLAASYVQIGDWEAALLHGELSLELGSPDVEYVMRLREEVSKQQGQ